MISSAVITLLTISNVQATSPAPSIVKRTYDTTTNYVSQPASKKSGSKTSRGKNATKNKSRKTGSKDSSTQDSNNDKYSPEYQEPLVAPPVYTEDIIPQKSQETDDIESDAVFSGENSVIPISILGIFALSFF